MRLLQEELAELLGVEVDLVSSCGLSVLYATRSWRPGSTFIRDDRAFLLHIRDALQEVRAFVEGTSY
jgi:hypothetical protein